MSNCATTKESNNATGVDTPTLVTKSDFIALKSKFDKLDINKFVGFTTSLNDLKTKVDDLDVGNLKTVPINSKKLSDVVLKEVAKTTVYNKLNTKVNSLE